MTDKNLSTTENRETAATIREESRSNEPYVAPFVDIYEDPDQLTLLADLPGASKESVGVDVEDGILTVRAKRQPAVSGDPVYREFGPVNYFRRFELSEAVDTEKISAELTNGVLTLILPKSESSKRKQIPINVN